MIDPVLKIASDCWENEVLYACNDLNFECCLSLHEKHHFIVFEGAKLIVNLVPVRTSASSESLLALQHFYFSKGTKLVHLWQDVWMTKSRQVLARITALLGFNIRLHGRKTKVFKIDKPTADAFLLDNHLQGPVSSRHKLGLFLETELVAVATFSGLRKMKHSENYTSAELIRFAIKSGFSVSGGLSKMLANFRDTYHPNDIMSYADCDWSAGASYFKLGFKQTAFLAPQTFALRSDFHRIRLKEPAPINVDCVFNTGSLKFILQY